MNRFLRAATLTIVVAVSGSIGAAQDYQKGLAAAQAGDFETALMEWRPLADAACFAACENPPITFEFRPIWHWRPNKTHVYEAMLDLCRLMKT